MYNNNIPQATDIPANSQAQILANFQGIQTLIDINHVTFDVADQGKHTFVTIPALAVVPPATEAKPGTLPAEVAVFSRLSTLTGNTELCVQFENNGPVSEFTGGLAATTGWTRLPSGILLKWGLGVANGDSTVIFPVAATIPVFTACYSCQLTVVAAAAGDIDEAVRVKALTPLNFTCYGSMRTTMGAHLVGFTYLAIGI